METILLFILCSVLLGLLIFEYLYPDRFNSLSVFSLDKVDRKIIKIENEIEKLKFRSNMIQNQIYQLEVYKYKIKKELYEQKKDG